MDAFSYTSLYTGPTVRFYQSTKNYSVTRLIRVGCCIFDSSKIHNIGHILLKQTPLKTPETLKNKFAMVSIQTKHLAIVIKVVRNQKNFEGILQFWENYTLEYSMLKKINVICGICGINLCGIILGKQNFVKFQTPRMNVNSCGILLFSMPPSLLSSRFRPLVFKQYRAVLYVG